MAPPISVTLDDIKRAHSAISEHVNLSPCRLSPRLSGRTDRKPPSRMWRTSSAGQKVEVMVETRAPEAVAGVVQKISAKGYRARPFTFE